jgi:hypothetical protein
VAPIVYSIASTKEVLPAPPCEPVPTLRMLSLVKSFKGILLLFHSKLKTIGNIKTFGKQTSNIINALKPVKRFVTVNRRREYETVFDKLMYRINTIDQT